MRCVALLVSSIWMQPHLELCRSPPRDSASLRMNLPTPQQLLRRRQEERTQLRRCQLIPPQPSAPRLPPGHYAALGALLGVSHQRLWRHHRRSLGPACKRPELTHQSSGHQYPCFRLSLLHPKTS